MTRLAANVAGPDLSQARQAAAPQRVAPLHAAEFRRRMTAWTAGVAVINRPAWQQLTGLVHGPGDQVLAFSRERWNHRKGSRS